MGTEIYVSSVVFNLAGDEIDRANYMKTTVVGGILHKNSRKVMLGETIVKSHLTGPGIRQRGFFRWAKNHYPLGMPIASLNTSVSVDPVIVKTQLDIITADDVTIQTSALENADIIFYAERHITDTYPLLIDTNWTVDFDTVADDIVIQYEDLSFEHISKDTYDANAKYLITYYTTSAVVVTVEEVLDEFGEVLIPEETEIVITSHVHIYVIGSGNTALDALYSAETQQQEEFFPFIPIRIHNVNVDEAPYATTILDNCTDAFKKGTGGNIADLITTLNSNASIDDIDHAFIVYGVPLNVVDNSARKYLYKFFEALMDSQTSSSDSNSNSIRINSEDVTVDNYDMRVNWSNITETFDTGLGKVGATVGEVWIDNINTTDHNIKIWHQTSLTTHKYLIVKKLKHYNYVYGTKKVRITATEALDDLDESGFLCPIHYPTLKAMSLVDSTQMVTANTFLIANAYDIVYIPWWQSGFFRILLIIVIVVVSVVFAPAGGSIVGLLGSNLAVGTFLGFTGMAAVIAGAIFNALAAIVLTQIITQGATSIFGEKLGAIIGAIAGFMVGFASFDLGTGSMTLNWGSMMRAENLMKLTDVAANAYAGWMQADTNEIIDAMGNATDSYEQSLEEIQKLMDELGFGGGFIDPIMFTTKSDDTEFFREPSDVFLSRTLMTGNDVVDMSFSMIEDFAEMTLKLPEG